ncbi:hypothetical protein K492DRAFT_75667 [Lichtheimia hyalospora FSU 10163]|nr:hypothetical protein K492DRAFT_75667 [Lichtheimia hyalospora FSU 10163]
MNFSATPRQFGGIKISDHLMAVNVRCHFNALGSSCQQRVSTLEPWQSSSLRISTFKYCMAALDAFIKPIPSCVPFGQDLDYLCLRYL